MQAMEQELAQYRQATQKQAEEIDQLRSERDSQWISEQRAQQIRGIVSDVLADSDTRLNLQSTGATSGYDKNFFIASADGNFRLAIKGQIQARFAYNHVKANATGATPLTSGTQSENEYGFELRRVKLGFLGHVFDPSWKYEVKFAFERNGGANNAAAWQNQVQIDEAYIEKDFGGGIFLRGGQWKDWFGYEEYTGSTSQQFVDRSEVNAYFNPKWVQGIVLGIQQDAWRTYLSYNDGGGNRSIQVIQTKNLVEWATTARAEILLAGVWNQMREMQGWVGSEFAAMLGGGLNWQRGTGVQGIRNVIGNGTIPGAPGGGEQASLITYTVDLNLRGGGWSVLAAAYGNTVYAFAPTGPLPGDPNSYGVTLQGGFFVTDKLELMARYQGLWVTNGVVNAVAANALNNQTLNILTVGANWYFHKNNLKFTTDLSYAFNTVSFNTGLYGDTIGGADWRSTVNAAGPSTGEIVLRAQMQLLF